jgi:hypothetical protein
MEPVEPVEPVVTVVITRVVTTAMAEVKTMARVVIMEVARILGEPGGKYQVASKIWKCSSTLGYLANKCHGGPWASNRDAAPWLVAGSASVPDLWGPLARPAQEHKSPASAAPSVPHHTRFSFAFAACSTTTPPPQIPEFFLSTKFPQLSSRCPLALTTPARALAPPRLGTPTLQRWQAPS